LTTIRTPTAHQASYTVLTRAALRIRRALV